MGVGGGPPGWRAIMSKPCRSHVRRKWVVGKTSDGVKQSICPLIATCYCMGRSTAKGDRCRVRNAHTRRAVAQLPRRSLIAKMAILLFCDTQGRPSVCSTYASACTFAREATNGMGGWVVSGDMQRPTCDGRHRTETEFGGSGCSMSHLSLHLVSAHLLRLLVVLRRSVTTLCT